MELESLLRKAGVRMPEGVGGTSVAAITSDSRRVEAGTLFVAIRGNAGDGHIHLENAFSRGALAAVVEQTGRVPVGAPHVVVPSTREALDRLAAIFYGEPARQLKLVGVTGTNGKTTLAYMIECILTAAGLPTGIMGTIDHHLGDRRWSSELTTPDPVTLQNRLREFVILGAKAAAFEISSHALDQARANSLPLDVGVFTNFTRDHLDYHGSLDAYFAAKETMFTRLLGRRVGSTAILNADDERVRSVQTAEGVRRWSFGEKSGDFAFEIQVEDLAGTTFRLQTPSGPIEMTLPCPGRHNVYNAAAAIAAGFALGVEAHAGAEALSKFYGAPGRLERVPNARGLHVFVDYAHTDDALRIVSRSLRRVIDARHAGARLITVFGCGGDRDRGKRPLMAQAATEAADVVILTSDNPRTEDPEAILDDIAAGVPADWRGEIHREVDRRRALARALQSAREGDVILVAGKGHEDYQIIGKTKTSFSDAKVLADLLKD